VNAYYKDYFTNRNSKLDAQITWINIYSLADALASNFRNDANAGNAEYGIIKNGNIPVNREYKIARSRRLGIIDFLTLYSLKAHGSYWDASTEGQSCMRQVYGAMKEDGLL
jgi:hypothetical protein